MKLRFYTLWAINAPLEERRLCEQLDQMRHWGFDGTVFHPRFYPNVPPYLSDDYLAILSRVIVYAKSIGMEFWIYDENGWPSGTVGGELLQRYPDDGQQWAQLVSGSAQEEIASFERDGKKWTISRRLGEGVDYLAPQLARHFLEMTYERYRQGLSAEAFEHVTTFFCDEPEFGLGHAYNHLSPHGAIPWTPRLPDFYRQRYDEELNSILPLLFFSGDGHRQARVRFWEMLTDVFYDSFISPIDAWCRQNGKRFTAHVKGEEHPLFQVPMVGSCHQVFQHLGLPGIDALERYPSGHFFPRQVASAAQQFGNGDCMVECFGGAGWGAEPGDLENYLNWLSGHGLNHFVLHLFQYRLTTHAMQDWPASIPAHVTWRDAFPQLLQRVRDHAAHVSTSADTLVIAPYRGIMEEYEPRELLQTNVHNASTYPDTIAGRMNREFLQRLDDVHRGSGEAYHVCDERTVEQHGKVADGMLHVSKCAYKYVTIDPAARLNSSSKALLASIRPPLLDYFCIRSYDRLRELPIDWEVVSVPENRLVIEAQSIAESHFAASFESRCSVEIKIEFADDVEVVTLNGSVLGSDCIGSCVKGKNEIRFICRAVGPIPYVAIRGRFAVFQRDNQFFLAEPDMPRPEDFVASGYPFCFEPITVVGKLKIERDLSGLYLAEVSAACARVRVDGESRGWSWGPGWHVNVPWVLMPGTHSIEVDLFPSTFNSFGPHHHVDGDRPIVSPVQYEYRKNFADRPEAPDNTFTAKWQLKRFGIGPWVKG